MARRVFFSYHFQRDAWRANQVRNSWVSKPNRAAAGYYDAADQEEVKRSSDAAVRQWIDEQLKGTSVTAVLIGEDTADRDYVQYEIKKSFERGNGLVGIRIDELKNREGQTCWEGRNPLTDFVVKTGNRHIRLSEIFKTYDWRWDNGDKNVGEWVEEAAEISNEAPTSWRQNLHHKEDVDESGILQEVATAGFVVGGLLLAGKVLDELLRQRGY